MFLYLIILEIFHKQLFTTTTIINNVQPSTHSTNRGPLDDAGKLEDISHVQTQYLARQFVAEMGVSEWRSRQFWSMLSIVALVFFLRLYLHYVSQWVYLRALNIPINKLVL